MDKLGAAKSVKLLTGLMVGAGLTPTRGTCTVTSLLLAAALPDVQCLHARMGEEERDRLGLLSSSNDSHYVETVQESQKR